MASGRHPGHPGHHARSILVLTRVLPSRRNDGSAAYLDAIVRYLAVRGHRVHLHWCPSGGPPVCRVSRHLGASVSTSDGVVLGTLILRWPSAKLVIEHVARSLWLRDALRRVRAARAKLRGRWGMAGKQNFGAALVSPLDDSQQEELQELVRRTDPDVVIANYAPLTRAFPDTPEPRPLRVVLTHDVWHQRLQDLGADPSMLEMAAADGEAALLGLADVVVAIQDVDAATFRAMLPRHDVVVSPMSVQAHPPATSGRPGRCLYVGSQSPTNVEGLTWLLTEVWPLVLDEMPQAELDVVGNVCRAIDQVPLGVRLRGPVGDLASAYGEASICVAPYLRGSGLKIKIVESFTRGRACVTTTAGAVGLEDLDGRAMLVRDDPQGFADAVVELLRNPDSRSHLEAGSLRVARERFRPEVALASLIDAIERPR